jgi:hypothetical protein
MAILLGCNVLVMIKAWAMPRPFKFASQARAIGI